MIGSNPLPISSMRFEKALDNSVINVPPLPPIASWIRASILLFVPITKPAIVIVRTAATPIVQPTGPVPKASNAPPNPNAPPTTAFNTSQMSPLPDTRLAIPLVPSTIPVTVKAIPRGIDLKSPATKPFISSKADSIPEVNFQARRPKPIATTTSFIWSKLSLIKLIKGVTFL